MDAIRLSPPRRLSLPVDNRWGAGEMSVLDFGDPKRPVDLVFVHANGFNAMTYRTLLAPLSGTLRIWAPDLRGHGRTTLPTEPQGRRGWSDHRDDLVALLDSLDGRRWCWPVTPWAAQRPCWPPLNARTGCRSWC